MPDIDHTRRTSFDRAAEAYDRARPSYPDAVIEAIAGRTHGNRVLEIGAGTGKATEVFARHGYHVLALEPGANLAALLRNKQLPRVRIAETTFEAWEGAADAFDIVTAAQAIHWIEPSVRYVKSAAVLRPGGALAIIRTEKAPLEPDLQAELDALYGRFMPRDEPRNGIDVVCRECRTEIEASGRFGPVHVERLPWRKRYATRDFLALLATYSDHAALDDPRRAQLFDAITAALERRGGAIEIPYVTLLFIADRA
jgi:SAM-dependent methyltransferase